MIVTIRKWSRKDFEVRAFRDAREQGESSL